mmetsp:Transcript_2663/g.5554  ORF Transcript_2663/g.5554 Transcript_2663/m.5554 type:complete len:151 (+) Transcript_2663:82-534(+)
MGDYSKPYKSVAVLVEKSKRASAWPDLKIPGVESIMMHLACIRIRAILLVFAENDDEFFYNAKADLALLLFLAPHMDDRGARCALLLRPLRLEKSSHDVPLFGDRAARGDGLNPSLKMWPNTFLRKVSSAKTEELNKIIVSKSAGDKASV